jgi:ATP-dependent helicase/nuclease subunit A
MSGPARTRPAADADEPARRAAQAEFDRPVILTAGAGTGKTTALVARILTWCLDPGWRRAAAELPQGAPDERIAAQALDGVVAITFTEAGAAEMAARVAQAFGALARGAGEEAPALHGFRVELLGPEARGALARRADVLLGALDHLTAETIHAFCRRLLARHPLAAGIHPRIAVDADLAASEEVVADVVERAARAAYASEAPHPLIELAELGLGPDAIAAQLLKLVERAVPPWALARDPYAGPGLAEIHSRLRQTLDALAAAGAERLAAVRTGSKALAARAAWRSTLEQVLPNPPRDLGQLEGWLALLESLWEGTAANALREWSHGKFTKGELEAVGEAAPAVARAASALRSLLEHLSELAPRRLDLARRALAPLLAEATAICRSRGLLTFAALLRGARDLLHDHPEIASRESERIRQLLVDEFQDTDPLQCDLVRALALGPGRRPGLFLVGDAKQSIFGWRDADLEAFEAFRDEVLAAGGVERELAVNFRSQPAVLEEVERVIEPVMVAQPGLQPPYRPLRVGVEAAAPGLGEARAPVEHWVSWDFAIEPPAATRADRAAEIEAAAIAADLAALHAEDGVPWSAMALLLRSTTWVDSYLDALRAAGVPFVVTRDKLFYRRREVIEAAALVRAVVDPGDELALATVLRSPVAGVPDAALLPLWRRGLPRLAAGLGDADGTAVARIGALLDEVAGALPRDVPGLERIPGWPRSAADACAALAELRRAFAREPADRFIEALRGRTLLEALQAACHQGKFRLANLERLFRRVETALAERGHDMAAILRALRRSLDRAPDAPQALPKDTGDDVVQVLTIHKAKGLEFRHVYVGGLHSESGRDREVPFDPMRPEEYALFGWPTPGFHAVAARRERIEAAERVRTLYVAMTRAKERIVLAGCWPERQEPRAPERASHHVDLLLHRRGLPPSLADLAEQCRRDGRAAVDLDGARWRFLGLAPPAVPAGRRAGTELPVGLEELAAGEARLAEARAAAGARQAMPWARPAAADAAAALAALHAAREDDERPRAESSRDIALLVGTAVHRLFEGWDLDADPERELVRQRARLEAWLSARAADPAPALRRSGALLHRLERGDLLRRFLALRSRVLARELPVLLPPDGGCVGFVAGAIDLVVEGEDGRPLIVDFKTDEVETAEELAERAAAYASQEAAYARAVGEALGLPGPPPCELWFLWADRVWPLGLT